MSDLPPNWELLLERHLAGECTPAELMEINRVLAGSSELRQSVELLQASRERARTHAGDLPHPELTREAVRGAWSKVAPRFADARIVAPVPQRIHRAYSAPRFLGTWALAAAVIVSIGLAAHYSGSSRLDSLLHGREYATRAGQRLNVTLSDGTRLTLGPASHIRLATDFGIAGRQVSVDGEAYFSVVHDANHPFSVRVRRATVTDIGTQFDVRAYADDPDVRVAVSEGQVAITTRRGRLLATHGDVAIIDTTVVITHGANVATMTAWVQGRLVFTNTPLRDVVSDLARTFDLDITVADSSLMDKPITAAFAGEPVDFVLDNVTAVIGAQFERTGRRVAIRRRIAGSIRERAPGAPAPLSTAEAANR